MAEGLTKTETKRVAVVTGSNKGIGLEICKQLASKGIVVVLTARNEKRGKEALENFKGYAGLSDLVVFHQLDVVDPASVASLADFVKTQFGKLDILGTFRQSYRSQLISRVCYFHEYDSVSCNVPVNNAGIDGSTIDEDALKASEIINNPSLSNWNAILIQTYELAVQCLETNYYGAKRMVDAFIPLLHLSDSPRIVNVSSMMGQLKSLSNEWAKGIFSDVENLSEERVDEVVKGFLKDFKEDSLKANGWPPFLPAYSTSKAAMNAYTRILARKYPSMCINCCCPGFVKTDLNRNTGILSVEEGAATPAKLALLPDEGPSGLFFDRNGVSSFD